MAVPWVNPASVEMLLSWFAFITGFLNSINYKARGLSRSNANCWPCTSFTICQVHQVKDLCLWNCHLACPSLNPFFWSFLQVLSTLGRSSSSSLCHLRWLRTYGVICCLHSDKRPSKSLANMVPGWSTPSHPWNQQLLATREILKELLQLLGCNSHD